MRSTGELVRDSSKVGKDVGRSAAKMAKSGANAAGHAAKGFVDEIDRTAKSPLLVSCYNEMHDMKRSQIRSGTTFF